ncbi:hypothetical protein CC86DRAFT_402619 [Ophiobolus disseminans]|uniref:Uncharacterized protein n=1 Tax=Ophiobolus disseminans TaxID=1469910 RepID=A0A6A7ABH9_9PLEO|nr:hypothetical protein CC86DRAFT_402619 [Ophiobolus disseminans]
MLSLPLAKLSSAQDAAPEESKFIWSHETQNLVVVIDTYGATGPPSQLLKVVQGTQVRHFIELENLVKESNDLIRRMREHSVELKNEQLPISALVRCPLLAIRWQLPNKKIRRAQLKFKTSDDYDIAYSHLHQLGLRMNATPETQSRTSTPNSVKTLTTPDSPLHSTATRHAVPASSSYPPARLTEVSHRPYTATNAPTSVESQVQEAAHARPASAYTGYANDARNRTNSFSGPLRPPEYFARPDSDTSAVLDLTAVSPSYYQHERPYDTVEQASHSSNDRPETAMLYNRLDTAEASLPPRRELPFARSSLPRSAGSDSARPSSRPSSVMMGPPPLPARVASLRPPSSRAANPEPELPPLPKPTAISSAQQQPSWMQQPPRTPNQDQITPPSAQLSIFEDQENRPQSSSSQNSSPLSYKRASTAMGPSARPLSSLSNAAQNRRSTESQSPQSTPPTSDALRQTHVRGEKSNAQEATSENNLAAYAMQSAEGRRAALNEFLFQQLEDPNFLTLLEDMETCWARAGMPKK